MAKKKTVKKVSFAKETDDGKACALLAYLVVGIIWYFADDKMRKNAFARYHTKQGLVLWITWIIASIVASILFFIPFLWWVFYVILIILMVLGILNAVNGKMSELPIIGQFAKKFEF